MDYVAWAMENYEKVGLSLILIFWAARGTAKYVLAPLATWLNQQGEMTSEAIEAHTKESLADSHTMNLLIEVYGRKLDKMIDNLDTYTRRVDSYLQDVHSLRTEIDNTKKEVISLRRDTGNALKKLFGIVGKVANMISHAGDETIMPP